MDTVRKCEKTKLKRKGQEKMKPKKIFKKSAIKSANSSIKKGEETTLSLHLT